MSKAVLGANKGGSSGHRACSRQIRLTLFRFNIVMYLFQLKSLFVYISNGLPFATNTQIVSIVIDLLAEKLSNREVDKNSYDYRTS